jgi:hypothetical protein
MLRQFVFGRENNENQSVHDELKKCKIQNKLQFLVSCVIAKHNKPFSDIEFVKIVYGGVSQEIKQHF